MSSVVSPNLVLAAFSEPLLAGRRVILFGDATSGLAEQLVEHGARLVQVCDLSAERAAEAAARSTSRTIAYAGLDPSAVVVREAGFDFGIIDDLSAHADARAAVKLLRRALAPSGVGLIASPNPDVRERLLRPESTANKAIGYYDLYDIIIEDFSEVRMLGQTPFVGYALADFAPEDDSGISLDTSLVPGGAEEPEWFLALVSEDFIDCDSFSIVQLPFKDIAREGPPAPKTAAPVPTEAGSEQLQAELERSKSWAAELEARAVTADARADEAENTAQEYKLALEKLKSERDEFERERAQAERAIARHKQATEAAEGELGQLKSKLEQVVKERTSLSTRVDSLTAQLTEQAERLSAMSEAEETPSDVAALEEQLRERAQHVRLLEQQLKEAQRVGTELIRELERTSSNQGETESSELELLRERADTLAKLSAQREADLTAANWTIQQLRGRLPHPVGSLGKASEPQSTGSR